MTTKMHEECWLRTDAANKRGKRVPLFGGCIAKGLQARSGAYIRQGETIERCSSQGKQTFLHVHHYKSPLCKTSALNRGEGAFAPERDWLLLQIILQWVGVPHYMTYLSLRVLVDSYACAYERCMRLSIFGFVHRRH